MKEWRENREIFEESGNNETYRMPELEEDTQERLCFRNPCKVREQKKQEEKSKMFQKMGRTLGSLKTQMTQMTKIQQEDEKKEEFKNGSLRDSKLY